MVTLTNSDRGELVDLPHADTQAYLGDAFIWLRDLAAKGARDASDIADDWSKELAELQWPDSGLQTYLQNKDSWVAHMFADVLGVVEQLNPLTLGKEIVIWVLEDFRDILRALALLVDSQDDTSEQTQDALLDLALGAAALGVPYVGRAGKIIARFARGLNSLEDVLRMLRHIGPGDAVGYLKKLNLPQYAGAIVELLRKILGIVRNWIGKFLPRAKAIVDGWVAKIGGWVRTALTKAQSMLNNALAALQKRIFEASSNMANSKIVDKLPDPLLDWVANQINGNLCESCVDNYIVNFMGYTRLFPAPDTAKRDTSSFFGPDRGIDGLFEKPAHELKTPSFPADYSGIPLSFGAVLDELGLEVEGSEIPRQITGAIRPFGRIPAEFKPNNGLPPNYPQFVVMEAKFGFHAKSSETLTDKEWLGRLEQTANGRQMSQIWITQRLNDIYPPQMDGTTHPKRSEIDNALFTRWLYGCQPHKPENSKLARPRNGKRRLANLAFFPPYAIKGFDIDKMKWRV